MSEVGFSLDQVADGSWVWEHESSRDLDLLQGWPSILSSQGDARKLEVGFFEFHRAHQRERHAYRCMIC